MEHKLLFVASTHSHISHFHLPYLRALKGSGWTIHTACGGEKPNILCADESIELPFEKKMHSPRNFRAARILRKKIRAEGYEVVIVHTSLAAFFTRLALLGMKNRPRVINMVHGYLFDDQTSPLKRAVLMAAEQLTAPVTDLLLTMNRWDYETALTHKLSKHVAYVPGIGVDFHQLAEQCSGGAQLRSTLGISAESFALIYPAEFSNRKSQSVLLHAMTQLPEHVVLVLPGSGVMLEECRVLAEQLGIVHRVFFPGYISEMGPWYDMADAAVSASRIEGLPFNIMEAMYCGLPVVASEVKGHTDLIRSGETGLLYPYGDAAACAEQVTRLISSPELSLRIGEQAKEDVTRYGLDEVFPQVMAQYESILGVPALK